jgi:AraC family transcriptional regulator
MNLDSGSSVESMALLATNQMNAYVGMAVLRGSPIHETLAQELSVAAAQLIEAACKARGGDCEATRWHIAHAIALLRGIPSLGPCGTHLLSNAETRVVRGGLPAWQTRKVIAHVEANLSRRIHMQELATLLGLSASHFCRAFKCAFGTSPRDYVLCRRIEVAQAMMLTTSEPLSAIALRCGMCDQAHFTRSFRRIVGETPSMWRRTRRGSLNVD